MKKTIKLADSDLLAHMLIKEKSHSLVLVTVVILNTKTNKTTVSYTVRLWAHEDDTFVIKEFQNYAEAFKYYTEIFEKYKNK